MQRQREGAAGRHPARNNESHKDAPERHDASRLYTILAAGFGVAQGYSTVSRDRYYVRLANGVGVSELQRFCESALKGSPMPGADPIRDGPALLRIFTAARDRGLVELEFVPADRFIPEKR